MDALNLIVTWSVQGEFVARAGHQRRIVASVFRPLAVAHPPLRGILGSGLGAGGVSSSSSSSSSSAFASTGFPLNAGSK